MNHQIFWINPGKFRVKKKKIVEISSMSIRTIYWQVVAPHSEEAHEL